MNFGKVYVDLYAEEQGSFPPVLQSETKFLLSLCLCCRSLFHIAVSFSVQLPEGELRDTHTERTRGRSAVPPPVARLHQAWWHPGTDGASSSRNVMGAFCECDPPFKPCSVHIQGRSNTKEYFSVLCLSCTISTREGWRIHLLPGLFFSGIQAEPNPSWGVFRWVFL